MRGLIFLLLSAWAAAAWLPVKGYGIVGTRQGFQLRKRYPGRRDVSGGVPEALHKRAEAGPVNDYCRYWGHSSELATIDMLCADMMILGNLV